MIDAKRHISNRLRSCSLSLLGLLHCDQVLTGAATGKPVDNKISVFLVFPHEFSFQCFVEGADLVPIVCMCICVQNELVWGLIEKTAE
jgi:hypothetical protein